MPTWVEFWDSVSVLQIVGWILAIGGFIAFAVKGWPTVKAFVAFIDALFSLPKWMEHVTTTLAAQDVKIEGIHHETHHNNGSSLKDSQRRTEDSAKRIEAGVRGLYNVVGKVVKDNPALTAELDNTRPPRAQRRSTKETQ